MEVDKISDCEVCGGSKFTLADGLYFCEECGTQNKFAVEVVYDVREEFRTKTKIQLAKTAKQSDKKLTSFEEYNYYLHGMLHEIMDIDSLSPTIKMTTLQIWMAYLKETEIAFFSPDQPELPRLFANHASKDADILYGIKPESSKKKRVYKKVEQTLTDEKDFAKKRKIMRKSEFNLSRLENESVKNSSVSGPLSTLSLDTLLSTNTKNFRLKMEYSKHSSKVLKRIKKIESKKDKRVTVKDLQNPEKVSHITPVLLISLLYCALRVDNCDIQLSDLVRLIREGNISFLDLKHFLPEDHQNDAVTTGFVLPSYDFLRVHVTYLGNFIPGLMSSLCAKPPDLLKLCKRYINELSLPEDLLEYVDKLLAFIPPSFKHPGRFMQFHNYEGRAFAYIIFLMKLIFGMDDDREIEMSRAARKINTEIREKNIEGVQMLFDFESWRDFVEYRKMMISRFYFPLIFSQDNVNQETYSSYIGFLESLRLKEINIEEPTRKSGVKFEQKIRIRANAKDILLELIQKHNSQEVVSKEVSYVAFKPSLMPYTEYFEYIKESYADQLELNQEILETNHQEVSLENFLQWRPFVEKLQAAGLDVEVQKSKINKNLRIIHQLPKATKSIYKLSHKIKEEKWVNYMKNREEKREGPKRKLEELNAYKLTVDKVLMQRKYWRDEIKYKKSTDKEGDIKTAPDKRDVIMFQDDFPLEMNLDDSKPIQPQVYKEPTMLCDLSSDSEFDDEDILLEELKKNSFQIPENEESSNATKNPNESKLKFIVPDFNYWNRNFVLTDPHRTPAKDINLKNLPKNFQWLIKTCASLLHMSPEILYVELMVIEYYYLYDLKPLELIENILKFQTPIDHKFRLYKQAWNENMRKRL